MKKVAEQTPALLSDRSSNAEQGARGSVRSPPLLPRHARSQIPASQPAPPRGAPGGTRTLQGVEEGCTLCTPCEEGTAATWQGAEAEVQLCSQSRAGASCPQGFLHEQELPASSCSSIQTSSSALKTEKGLSMQCHRCPEGSGTGRAPSLQLVCKQHGKQNHREKPQRPRGDGERAGGEKGRIDLLMPCESF